MSLIHIGVSGWSLPSFCPASSDQEALLQPMRSHTPVKKHQRSDVPHCQGCTLRGVEASKQLLEPRGVDKLSTSLLAVNNAGACIKGAQGRQGIGTGPPYLLRCRCRASIESNLYLQSLVSVFGTANGRGAALCLGETHPGLRSLKMGRSCPPSLRLSVFYGWSIITILLVAVVAVQVKKKIAGVPLCSSSGLLI